LIPDRRQLVLPETDQVDAVLGRPIDYFGASASGVKDLFETTAAVFRNISYFNNRPHSVCEGILAKYRPQLVQAASINEQSPWNRPLKTIEDLFPYAHLHYAAHPDDGANGLDLEEMRPLLERMKEQTEALSKVSRSGSAADRWSEVRGHALYGYHLARLMIAMVDVVKADLENQPQGADRELERCLEHLRVLISSEQLGRYRIRQPGRTWGTALRELAGAHPGTGERILSEFPQLRNVDNLRDPEEEGAQRVTDPESPRRQRPGQRRPGRSPKP